MGNIFAGARPEQRLARDASSHRWNVRRRRRAARHDVRDRPRAAGKYIYRLGKPIAELEEVRDFGKRLLALKVTATEAQGRVALADVLAAFQIDPGRPAEWLPRVKARLIGLSASVSAALA